MMRHIDLLADPNEQIVYMRSNIIGALVTACAHEFVESEGPILDGTYNGALISNLPDPLLRGYRNCSYAAYAKIYFAPEVADIEIAGNRILTYILQQLTDAVLNPEKNYSRLLLGQMPQQYETSAPTLYERLQSVLDHVSGMTDVYALNLFRKLNGHSLPAV